MDFDLFARSSVFETVLGVCYLERIHPPTSKHYWLPEQPGSGGGGALGARRSGAAATTLPHGTGRLLRMVITKLGQKPKLGGVRISTDITFMFTHFIPAVGVHPFSLYNPLVLFSRFLLVCLKYFD